MKESLNIAIAGATGYVGLELVKILSKHPKVKIKYLCATKSIGKNISIFDKKIKKKLPKISNLNKINWREIDLIFTALPNGEAQKIAKQIPEKIKLIDLSGDFRLNNHNLYKKYYKINHNCKNLIKKSLYSVTEFSRKKLPNYNIISCPGCYPTSIQLPLIPLVKNKLIKTNQIIIDSKSGYSGAGRKIEKKLKDKSFLKSMSAYGIGNHKHTPEINQELSKYSNQEVSVYFTPHIIPVYRGILSTIYLDLRKNYNAKKIYVFLKKYHKKNFFVKMCKFNSPIGTSSVLNTNKCNISVCKGSKNNKIIIISAIDNLVKGASGQAVQNMNIAYGFKENLGLL
jgi:N-acetyl-gamma-glutamyl-phosphate reductase